MFLKRVHTLCRKVEDVEGTFESSTISSSNALLAYDPEVTIEKEVIERQLASSNLTKTTDLMGRSTVKSTFKLDFIGGGSVATEPAWGPLIQACGMQKVTIDVIETDGAGIVAPITHGDTLTDGSTTFGTAVGSYSITSTASKVYFVKSATISTATVVKVDTTTVFTAGGSDSTAHGFCYKPYSRVKFSVATGGISGSFVVGEVAKCTKTGENDCYIQILEVSGSTIYYEPILEKVVSGAAITGQSSSATATASADGSPVSNYTLSLVSVLDGAAIKSRGNRGTFSIPLEAGNPAMIEFEFNGLLEGVADNSSVSSSSSLPTALRFHEAHLQVDSMSQRIQNLSIEMNNSIVPRANANATDGADLLMITDRDPKVSINPELLPPGTYDFWSKWSNATTLQIRTRMGMAEDEVGSSSHTDMANIFIDIDKAQIKSLPFGERDGIVTGEIELTPTKVDSGDDEIVIYVL